MDEQRHPPSPDKAEEAPSEAASDAHRSAELSEAELELASGGDTRTVLITF